MTSEIRVNKLQNRVGLGTVEYTNTGIVVSGIVTCTELSGLTALNIAGVGTANTLDINGDIDVDGHTNLDNVSVAGVTTFSSNINVTGEVGIGTDNPGMPLHLSCAVQNAVKWQSSDSDGPITHYYNGSTHLGNLGNSKGVMSSSNLHFGIGSKSDLLFGTKPSGGGSTLERLRITSDGVVSVGNQPKSWHSAYKVLQVGAASLVGQVEGDGTTSNWSNNAYFDTTNNRWEYSGAASDEASQITLSDGLILFKTAVAGTANNALTWIEKLRIESGGGLKFTGQGTSIPVGGILHHTNNNLYVRGGTSGLILGNQDSTTTVQIFNGYIKFETNDGTEKLRITSAGYVGVKRSTPLANLHVANNELAVGTNPAGAAAPNATYDGLVVDGSNASFINIRTRGNGSPSYGRVSFSDDVRSRGYVEYRHEDGSNDDQLRFATSSTVQLIIDSSGNIGINESAPSEKLQIDGDILLGGQANPSESNYAIKFEYNNHQFAKIVGDGRDSSGYGDIDFYTSPGSGASNLTQRMSIRADGKIGMGNFLSAVPSNQLHIAGTTGLSAGGLLRLDATTGDNFIIFDNTHDSTEWVIGNDSGTRDNFDVYYNNGSGYPGPIVKIDGTHNNGKVTIDGGTTTLVQIRADSSGTAGLRLGGQAGSGTDQCTGFVEVHQDETHGGGFFYNGDGSPAFANYESADYFSLFRASGGSRYSVMRWVHNSNDCEVQGNMTIDNGVTGSSSTLLRVQGDSAGTAGISCGGSGSIDNQTQCTGYLECHQDRIHGGGISYNGDGSPGFVNNETADHVTFYRMSNGTRERVFSYPYNTNTVSFRGTITATGANSSIKNFRITHPHPSKKDTHDLLHSSIEGPQCDNIYRGKVDLVGGTATINLDTVSTMTDGTFVLLNRDVQCFTTNETGWTNVKGSVTGNQLTIIAQENTCTDTISWMVIGERQDDILKSSDVDNTDADGKLIVELLKSS